MHLSGIHSTMQSKKVPKTSQNIFQHCISYNFTYITITKCQKPCWPGWPCLPTDPFGPGSPIAPAGPGRPAWPVAPVKPRSPDSPSCPGDPCLPGWPIGPARPGAPVNPGLPTAPVKPADKNESENWWQISIPVKVGHFIFLQQVGNNRQNRAILSQHTSLWQ